MGWIDSAVAEKQSNALASQIREAAWKLEDVLELHELCLDDNEEVEEELRSFIEKATKILIECSKLVEVMDDHTDESSFSLTSYYGGENKTLGISETFCVLGMAGIGKTTLVLEYFEESKEKGYSNIHAFVTVGQKYQLRGVLLDILSQIGYPDDLISVEEVEELGLILYKSLFSNRFLVVLDDVWDIWVLKELSRFLPENNCGREVIFTSRREIVATASNVKSQNVVKMPFLNSKESWDLFCANAFQKGESCPHELVEVGKKIAEYCEGLPLAIITVGKLLAKAEKTVEYWLKVASGETSVFEEASEKMSPVLLPSYLYLPMDLKQCFLYHGVFPCKSKIGLLKMMLLLEAEEFLEVTQPSVTFQRFASDCLKVLTFENVTIIDETDSIRLHFSYWYLCVKEAERGKFYKVIKRRANAFAEDIERERRICIHNNVLLGIKDVYKSVARCSTARSILCTGPYHRCPVPIFFNLKLLKVLDAETVRFCEFPIQLVTLVQLRYLALTCGRKLPASISKLCNLQYLIVKEHLCIRHSHVPMYLPMEIWDMKELKHLQVMGADLPEPAKDHALLENLMTLMGVSGHTCTKRVLERIPNVKNLIIRTELSPSGTFELIGGFDNFHHLNELRLLSCYITNPRISTPEAVHWPIKVSSFPSSLQVITLSGQGYLWTTLTNIAMLLCLEMLYVQDYACRGSEWIVSKEDGFVKLKSLQIEDTDLEHWEVEEGAFPILEKLTIKHCYKLKQLPKTLAYNSITEITLDDCNPLLPKTLAYYNDIAKISENDMVNISGHGNPIHIVQSFKY